MGEKRRAPAQRSLLFGSSRQQHICTCSSSRVSILEALRSVALKQRIPCKAKPTYSAHRPARGSERVITLIVVTLIIELVG
jgi:hypothetical protein